MWEEPPSRRFSVSTSVTTTSVLRTTIVGTDQHDVYVEELNPANENEVKWNGKWEALRVVREEIKVKVLPRGVVEMKFSRHGPIFHVDRARNRAYALRSALHEPGTAPYLAGLQLSQVRDARRSSMRSPGTRRPRT